MSETRDAFGPLLQRLQADVRGLRADMRALRDELGNFASRDFINARAAETEAMIDSLFDRLNQRMDQTERSTEERLTRIEGKLP